MLSTQSLREQLDRYATDAISAEALEEWLAAESWDMRRWVPIGVQRFIEAIQVAFINYADHKMSDQELRNILLQRRDQLHRAGEVTKKALLRLSERPVIDSPQEQERTVAETQAITVAAVAA